MSTSLLINTYINDELKYNHFKITFKEIYEIFDSIHIKIRGAYKNKCIEYAKLNCQEKKQYLQSKLSVSKSNLIKQLVQIYPNLLKKDLINKDLNFKFLTQYTQYPMIPTPPISKLG